MASPLNFLTSTLGKKFVVAITGIGLFLFIVLHMVGNLQIFEGPDRFNGYAAFLKSMPGVLWAARIGLISLFILHIIFAVQLKRRSMSARPTGYMCEDTIQASYASRTMLISGTFILLYVVYHIAHFTLGLTHPQDFHLIDSQGRHDVYSMVIRGFQIPWVTAIYLAGMAFVCFHLSHAIVSFFQTLGISGTSKKPRLKQGAILVSLLIFLGYISIPLSIQFGLVALP